MEPTFQLNFGSGFAPVPPPANWKATRLEGLFTSPVPSATIQSILYEWDGANAIQINQYIAGGISGSTPGILEGPGCRIYVGTLLIGNYCIDLANAATLIECDVIKAPLKVSGNVDWINDNGYFTYAYLATPIGLGGAGLITASDYKKTPYCITTIPDGPQLTMLMLEEYVMVQQCSKEITDLTKLGEQLAGGATTEVATLATTSADLAADILECVEEVAYIVILGAGIASTTKQIFDQIVQVKKYKYCMRVEDLFKKACQFINIPFSSSIFAAGSPYHDLTIMPKKIIIPKPGQSVLSVFNRPADENGNPLSYGYYEGTFKQMMEQVGLVFNAKPNVLNGALTFEEIHNFLIQSGFILPPVGPGDYTANYPDPHGVNASELSSTYDLHYSLDQTDENTVHQYGGTSCQVLIQPKTVNNNQNLLLPGLTDIELPFAAAKRKEYLSFVEQKLASLLNAVFNIFNAVISIINTVIGALNTIIGWFGGNGTTIPSIPLLPTVGVKVGFLELSNDSFETQKIFIGQNVGGDWMVHPNNASLMAAATLIQNFHGKNLLSRGNQYLLYKQKRCAMCASDFLSILNHNLFKTPDGKIGKFDKILWNPHEEQAESIDYRIQETWTNNYNETIIIDGN